MTHIANPDSKKFKIVTLGCRTNQYESQAYHDQLVGLGLSAVEGNEVADVCIVNTCTVTAAAEKDSRREIRKLAEKNPGSKLVVTGCAAEGKSDSILQIGGVSRVVPNAKKEDLIAELFPEAQVPEFSIQSFDSHTRAFVKVQDGCNSFCTYCIIPYVRGRSRSRHMHEILEEIQQLIANGYKEVVITGINVGDFDGGKEEQPDRLADLVRAVDQIPGLERLRVSSIDPDEVDENLASAILGGKTTCPSMHIVLQSGSNVILKRMNRKYTRQIFLETVERLKNANPHFTFTTDVIVGFPGETETDFEETIEIIKEVRFAKVHMFPYSDRPRTRSNLMPNKVPPELIQERKQKVLRTAEEASYALRQEYVGKKMLVLTESRDGAKISGHTDNFLPVIIQDETLAANQIILVELLENTPSALIGRVACSQ